MANDTIKRAKDKAAQLGEMQEKPGLSDVFTSALIGFLPLIAGIGSSEDTASLAPIGLEAMKSYNTQRAQQIEGQNAVNAQALSMVGAEDAAAAKSASEKAKLAFEQSKLDQQQKGKMDLETHKSQLEAGRPMTELQRADLSLKRKDYQLKEKKLNETPELKPNAFEVQSQKESAKKAVDWQTTGRQTADNSIATLEEAIKNLKADPSLVGRGTGVLPDVLTSQKVLDQRQNIHSALISGVKATFPGSVTEKETDLFIKSKYNEQASAAQNEKTLTKMLEQLKQGRDANNKLSGQKPSITKQQAMDELARRKAAK